MTRVTFSASLPNVPILPSLGNRVQRLHQADARPINKNREASISPSLSRFLARSLNLQRVQPSGLCASPGGAIVLAVRKMPEELCSERPLFGGAIGSRFPNRFEDVSNIRQVPDHQEVFVDPSRDESLIFELLDFKHEVGDSGSAVWFLQDLATEQDAEQGMVIERSAVVEAPGLTYRNIPAVVTTAVGQMAISKGRQGREAQNIVRVYLANLRLKEVGTDVLIAAYEPILINPLSESARTVGAGLTAPASQSGYMPMAEVFKLAVSSFKVNDWGLFGSSA